MDGQDSGQRKKPHGNQHPKRGNIMKTIITDWTGGGGDSKKSPGTATSPGGGAKDDTNNGGGS
jgi:hypothetical protein